MLFNHIKIQDIELKNRIVMPPMCMYSANNKGLANDFHRIHYGARAQGGTGLIILEATGVSPEGRISTQDLGIWDDNQIPGLRSIVEVVHSFGAKIAIQLGHAGRKTETGKGFSCVNVPFSSHYQVPQAMDKTDIRKVIEAFGNAATRAQLAGFDLIEIHGAHGYLINQFLSPVLNTRMDEYGIQNGYALRFLTDIVSTIKKNFKNPVGLRISAEEYVEKGLHPNDYVKIISKLQENPSTHLNFLDVSSGGIKNITPTIPIKPGYQIPFAEILKKNLEIPVIGGGLITKAEFANQLLVENKIDLVWLGRELLRNPYWPLKAAEQLNIEIDTPTQYKRAEPYF